MRGAGSRVRAIRLLLLLIAALTLWLSANWWQSLATAVILGDGGREAGGEGGRRANRSNDVTGYKSKALVVGSPSPAERTRTADGAREYDEAMNDDENQAEEGESAGEVDEEAGADNKQPHGANSDIEKKMDEEEEAGEEAGAVAEGGEEDDVEEDEREEEAEDEEDALANEDPTKQRVYEDAARVPNKELEEEEEAEAENDDDADLQQMEERDQEQEKEEQVEQEKRDHSAERRGAVGYQAAIAAVGLEPELWSSAPTSAPFASAWFEDHVAAAGVRCDRLLAGNDELEVARAQRHVEATRSSLSCAAADAALADASCERLRATGYAREPASAAEAAFPLAFGLRMHTCAVQAELLLRTVYAPQNVYCLHVDAEAGAETVAAMRRIAACLPNVLLAPLDSDFVYASASQLRADLTCMRLLLVPAAPTPQNANSGRTEARPGGVLAWRYFLNLAGQELPLRTNAELVALLRAYNGSNELISEYKPQYAWRYNEKVFCKRKVLVRWRLDELRGGGRRSRAGAAAVATNVRTGRCRPPVAQKPLPPRNVTVYKGLGYGFYSREFVEYALREGGLGVELFAWFEDTWAPDEHFYATLARQPDAPGGYSPPRDSAGRSSRPKARAVRWRGVSAGASACGGKFVRNVCVFGASDLPWLARQPEAVANKFYLDYDPLVVQCLAEWVHRRGAARSTAAPAHAAASGASPQVRQRQQQQPPQKPPTTPRERLSLGGAGPRA